MKECSFSWAYNKAKVWANAMGRAELVVEFKRGRFDSMSPVNLSNQKVVCTVEPDFLQNS